MFFLSKSSRTTLLFSVLGTVLLAGISVRPAHAQTTTTITFDAGDPAGGLAVGATLGSQYAASGVTFVANAFTGAGGPTMTWATNTTMLIASSTGSDVGGLGTPSLVSGNLLRSFNGWLSEDGDPSFRAVFSTPIASLSAAFAGISTPADVKLMAFNGTTLLTTVAATTTTGQQVLTVSNATPITSVVFVPGSFNDWVGVDNITFTRPAAAIAPEPGAFALLATGILPLVGLVTRRYKRA